MSFGFSIGDFLGIIKDIHHIRRIFNGAPTQFKFLNEEMRRLSILIQDVETYIPNAAQKDKLEQIASNCKDLIQDIWEVIEKYKAIGESPSIKHVWKRLKMDPEDVRELRDRACSVIGALTDIRVCITQDKVQELVKYKNEEQHERYLDWLSSETFAADLGKPTYQPGTGKWFIESHEFQTWIQNRGRTLFCHGIPGAGKSSMASIIIDDLNHRYGDDPNFGIAYTFCSFRYCDDPRQSPDNVLASLIRQLIWKLPQLPSTIQVLYEKHRGNGSRPSFNDLCKVFKEVVQVVLKQAFIVIDALDECKAATVSRIISQIFETQVSGNLNFLATSRSVPAIQAKFLEKPCQEIRADKEDVIEYLKARLKDCEDCALSRRPPLQKRAISVIADSVNGMFLLAQLYLDSLILAPRAKDINAELDRLTNRSNHVDKGNAAVDDAYQNIVERIKNQDPRRQRLAKDTLSWVICAKRPLTPLELRTALTIELGELGLNDEDLYDLEDIISSCAGLITVGSDGSKEVVQLAHYTMHEYFTRHQAIFFPESDQTITASCLTYLSYDVFRRQGMCSNDSEFEDRLSQYPLYSYAAQNWGHHARVHSTVDSLLQEFLWSPHVLNASIQGLFSLKGYYGFESYCLRIPLGFTRFHLAAWFGLEKLLQFLISQGGLLCARDSTNRNPLAWAASNGHISVVKMLLEHEVDPLQHDDDCQTPLSLAALNGYTEVVKLFLDSNINPNSRDTHSKIPLIEASYGGHHETVGLLLNRGAHPDPKDSYGRTPFLWACYTGSVEVVRILLYHSVARHCIDYGWRDSQGNTAVSFALDRGHHDIIQLLREKGVLLEQESCIDELFCNRTSDARGDDVTADLPHAGQAVGWPFIETHAVSSSEQKSRPARFKCPICSHHSFGSASTLMRHVGTLHCWDTIWTCPFQVHSCGGSFNRRDKFMNHIRVFHAGEYNTRFSFDFSKCKKKVDPPAKCLVSGCHVRLGSWAAFNRCILKHSREISSTD